MRHSGPPLHVHEPASQPSAVAESQRLPQVPQLLRSLVVSTQVPLQHCSRPPQVRPQAPQFATLSRLAHDPPQHARPAPQVAPAPQRQTPPMHVSPAGQPPGHVAWHVPPTQG